MDRLKFTFELTKGADRDDLRSGPDTREIADWFEPGIPNQIRGKNL